MFGVLRWLYNRLLFGHRSNEKGANQKMTWEEILSDELDKPYFRDLAASVKSSGPFFPPVQKMFAALEFVPFERVKVVILGQDPYHDDEQANGLAFSVNNGQSLPPSLRNIFTEIQTDLGVQNVCGDLTAWANRGVLLLNVILTVSPHKPASHANLGWEVFTSKIISEISARASNVVFLLWGNHAHSREDLIDTSKHLVLKSPHPSPLSAHKGFFGCKHFSKTNDYLSSNGKSTIDWRTQ